MKTITFLLFCFFSTIQYAQLNKIDSLKTVLKDCKTDLCILEVGTKLFFVLSNYDTDKAFSFAKEKYNYFKLKNKEKGIAYSAQEITTIYRKYGDYVSSIRILNDALNNIENSEYRLFLLQNLAEDYRATENHQSAVKILNEALKIAYLRKDDFSKASIYSRLAANNFKLGTFEELKNNIDSSDFYAGKNKNLSLTASNYEILGAVYSFRNKHQKAIFFYNRSVSLNLKLKDTVALQNNYNNLGNTYYRMQDYSKAVKYLNKSADICVKKNFKMNLLSSITYLGHSYRGMKDYEKASFYFDSALNMRVGLFNEQRDIEIQNYIKKYEFQKKEILINQQNQLLEQKEINISRQKKQKYGLLTVFCLALILLTILLFFRRKLIDKNKRISEQKADLEKINKELLREYKKNKAQRDTLDFISDRYYNSYKNEKKQKQIILEQKKDLEKINTELKELSRFKELNTQMIVHDLKNPLNRIISTTSKDKKLRDSAQYMLNLVENILNVSKIEQNIFKVSLQQINLNEVVRTAYASTDFLFENKGVDFINELKSEYTVLADFEVLKRIFINLFSNSVKYTNSGGKVCLKASLLNDKLRIEIKDTGIGIEKKKLKEIFKIYKHRTSDKTQIISSSGIGLFFVKKAAEAHGSTIIASSEVATGTSFMFDLKLVDNKRRKVDYKPIKRPKLKLNVDEYQFLKPYIEKINTYKIYEISDLRAIIKQIESYNANVSEWKNTLLKSVENYNTNLFESLLNEVYTDQN